MDCNVTTCKSDEATERKAYSKSEKKTFVTRLCKTCWSDIIGKKIGYSYYKCGGLIFVESIWEVDNNPK